MSNPFFSAYINSDLFGKTIFLILFVVSILTWCIILQTALIQKTARRQSKNFQHRFLGIESNPLALGQKLSTPTNPFMTVYHHLRRSCLKLLEKNQLHSKEKQAFLSVADMESLYTQTEVLIAVQTRLLTKYLFLLSMAVTLAPFLGLLGTVWGSLVTLSALRHSSTLTGNSLVLEGLSMALATTVLGLLVAIPALVGHGMLKARARTFTRETRDFSARVLTAIEMQYRKVDP